MKRHIGQGQNSIRQNGSVLYILEMLTTEQVRRAELVFVVSGTTNMYPGYGIVYNYLY